MPSLALAALSARVMAQGFPAHTPTVALDVFGDRDTLKAAGRWLPIGQPGSACISTERFLTTLHSLARSKAASAWIAGGNFEGLPDALMEGSKLLPLLGTSAQHVRQIKDPQFFFDLLTSFDIDHPSTCYRQPDSPATWLIKQVHGSGGWHIRMAACNTLGLSASESVYFQKYVAGIPMSVTFLANGHEALILGFNELIVRPMGDNPFVFCGAIGPVPVSKEVRQYITQAVSKVTPALCLKGLCSLDFVLDGERCLVLEINPRPPASIALYMPLIQRLDDDGLMLAHCRACATKALPEWGPFLAAQTHIMGFEILYASQSVMINEADISQWSARTDCHDLPAAAMRFNVGQPICSLSASGSSVLQVQRQLARQLRTLVPQ